jgi:hypothetical protein
MHSLPHITLLRGTRKLAVQTRTISLSVFRAPCAAWQTMHFNHMSLLLS